MDGKCRSFGKNRLAVLLTAFFSVYMFEYMATLTFIDKGTALAEYENRRYFLHYADCGLVVAGFLLFAFMGRLPENTWLRRKMPIISGVMYIASVFALCISHNAAVYSAAAMTAALFLGVQGGTVYFRMSAALPENRFMGQIMSFGGTAAIIAQYLFQELLDVPALVPVMLALGSGGVMLLIYRLPRKPASTSFGRVWAG